MVRQTATFLNQPLGWLKNHPLATFTALVLLIIAGATIYGMTRPVSHDRQWVEHLSRLPHVERNGAGFHVTPIRDWSYGANGPINKAWYDQAPGFDFADLRDVWLMVEPHPTMEDAMAHTLVLFEFEDDRLLGLTIEARREAHEKFDPVGGNFGKFELIYVFASARDLLTRRAVFLDHTVEVYPLSLTRPQLLGFLNVLLKEAEEIEDKPRHYNTLFSNCTNELAKAAQIEWDPAFVATGFAALRLHERGVIPPSDEPFGVVREKADMTAELKLLNLAPPDMFDRELLRLLRARTAQPNHSE